MGILSPRASVIVDQWGFTLTDPTDGSRLGHDPIPPAAKIIYALQTNTQSGVTRRYLPAHPPGESCLFACDFSSVIPHGLGIATGTLSIFQNVVPPKAASTDFTVGAVTVIGRALYANLSGGQDATDYILQWQAVDTSGAIWPRSGLLLVTRTS